MDAEGNCLVVSPCNVCKQSKNGVQVCLVRKHNARLTAVKMEDLTSRHRQCVKPDQSMTIFKLVDRETGEESVEYAKDMVFQRPCERCQHLKSCIMSGHTLQDWVAEGNDSRVSKRKSMSSAKSPSPVYSPAASQGPSRGKAATAATTVTAAAAGGEIVASPAAGAKQAGKENLAEGYRAKRRKVDAANTPSAPSAGLGAAAEPRNGMGAGRAGAGAAGASDAGIPTTAQNIATRLQQMSAAEDRLRQQYQAEMQNLDKAEVRKLKEIEEAKAALERIHLIRKATKEKISEQRKEMSAERQRLTNLRVQAIIQEEEELRRQKEVLWRACEARSAELRRLQDEAAPAAAAAAAAAAASPSAVQEHGQAARPSPRGMLGSGGGGGGAAAPNGIPSVSRRGGGSAGAAGGVGLNVMNAWSSLEGGGTAGGRGNGDESEDSEVDINVEGGDTETGTGDDGVKEGSAVESTEGSGSGEIEGTSESPAAVQTGGGSSRDDEQRVGESMANGDDGAEGRNEKMVLAETETVAENEGRDEGQASATPMKVGVLVASEENGRSGHGTDGAVTTGEGDAKDGGKGSGEANEHSEREIEAPTEVPGVRCGEAQGGRDGEALCSDLSSGGSKGRSNSCDGKSDEEKKKEAPMQGFPNDGSTPAETSDKAVVAAAVEGEGVGRGVERGVDESGEEVVNVGGEAGTSNAEG